MVIVTRSSLVGRAAAKTAMLETVGRSNALNRTGQVDYNALGNKDGLGLKSVTEKFVDNFVLAILVPDYNVTSGKYVHCGSSNKSIRELLNSAGLEKCAVKAIDCRKAHSSPPDFMLKCIPFTDHTKIVESYYFQEYKVATPNLEYQAVMNFVRAGEYNSIGMFLKDFDVTMDFAGSFNKDEVIEYLVKECDFRVQGNENTLSPRTILDNDRFVGRNCLTYMEEVGGFVTRQKIYNKLVQMLESQSVRSSIGCHWRDWVVQQGTRLSAARDKATQRGLTRAEVTVYIDESGAIPSELLIEETLLKIIEYVPNDLVYSTPFSKTWEVYCNSFIHSLICIDRKEDIGLLVYSLNQVTGKLSGQLINEFEKKWQWVLENLTLNGNIPVDVIDITTLSRTLSEDKKKDCIIEVSGSRYFKNSPNKSSSFKTRLVSHKGVYSYTASLTAEEAMKMIKNAGFVPHKNCVPFLAANAANCNSKTSAQFARVEDLEVCLPTVFCRKKLDQLDVEEKLLEEALRIEEFRKPHLQNLQESAVRLQQIEECISAASSSHTSHLSNLNQGTYPVLSAKKVQHPQYGPRFKMILQMDGDTKTTVWSNWGLSAQLNRLLNSDAREKCYDVTSGFLIFLDKPLGNLVIKGKMLNKYGHYTVFCDFEPNEAGSESSVSAARTEATEMKNASKQELGRSSIDNATAIPVKPREELLPYRENPELSALPIGVIKKIEALGWVEWHGKDCLLVQVDGVMHQAGIDLESKDSELATESYIRIDKHRFNRNTRRKYALCTVIQSGEWHKLVDYGKTPLLKTQDRRTCVIDVKTVENKGQKRKLILTDKGEVFKLKKSKFEESLNSPGFI